MSLSQSGNKEIRRSKREIVLNNRLKCHGSKLNCNTVHGLFQKIQKFLNNYKAYKNISK